MERQPSNRPGGEPERRGAPRFHLQSRASFHTEEIDGWGTLRDISEAGARIDDASPRIKPGERVRLRFTPRPDCLPVEIWAEVVRETGTGFAVSFTSIDSRLKKLLRSITAEAGPPIDDEETQPFVSRNPGAGNDDPTRSD
jgi:hypothetical protein